MTNRGASEEEIKLQHVFKRILFSKNNVPLIFQMYTVEDYFAVLLYFLLFEGTKK